MKQVGLNDEIMEPLFNSAEKNISMWEGAELAAQDIDSGQGTEPPVLSLTISKPANDAGWHNQPFTIEINVSDENQLRRTLHTTIQIPRTTETILGELSPIYVLVALDEFDDQFIAISQDFANNYSDAKTVHIRIDQVPPLISASSSPQANISGWINQPVTVAYQCSDGFSGVSVCTDNQLLASDGTEQSSQGLAEDFAGNTAQAKVSGIKIDQTPPTIVATALPLSNAAGWINKPVTVTYLCDDGLSGVISCPETKVLSNDGSQQEVLALVSDVADNTARADIAGININQEPPLVKINGVEDGGDYFLGQVPTSGCVKTDSLSEVLEEAILSTRGGTSNSVGLYTSSCDNALDVADNASSESASYWVRYVFHGFYLPVDNVPTINESKAGLRYQLSST